VYLVSTVEFRECNFAAYRTVITPLYVKEKTLDEEVVSTARSEPQLLANCSVAITLSMDVTELRGLIHDSAENM
jgi:hypothetical protein